jgi:hypothetical protein
VEEILDGNEVRAFGEIALGYAGIGFDIRFGPVSRYEAIWIARACF